MKEVGRRVKDILGREVMFGYSGRNGTASLFSVFYIEGCVDHGDGTVSPPDRNWRYAVEVPHVHVLDFERVRAEVAGATDIVIDEASLERPWPVLYQTMLDKSKEDAATVPATAAFEIEPQL
jgi:hypothetical protein